MIEPFDFQALHLAFSEGEAILSGMEQEQSVRPTCRVVWSESSRPAAWSNSCTKGVLVENFILQKCRMQSNRDWSWIESEFSP